MPRPRKRKGRVYTRKQSGGAVRYYGDFRDFADVGGGQETLVAPGETYATTDPDVAQELAARRVRELEERRRSRTLLGIERQETLRDFVDHHLREERGSGEVTDRHLDEVEKRLAVAAEFLGGDRFLDGLAVRDVQDLARELGRLPNGRGGTLSPGSVRHYLNALSKLFTRAIAEGVVPPGHNPVAGMMNKPTAGREEARWLEVSDAALLMESARTYTPRTEIEAYPFVYPILATFLLTGGRKSEVLGLELDDLSFRRRTVTFRPNRHRRLKTSTSHRSVPLWPQLEEILRPYLLERERAFPDSELLFPSERGPGMIRDLRKALDAIGERAGWEAGEIRTKMFRHTYCAARLQTLDRGAPVAPWTVAREMGHGGQRLVERVYGHLGDVRHRSETIEYRLGQHREALRERIEGLPWLGEAHRT